MNELKKGDKVYHKLCKRVFRFVKETHNGIVLRSLDGNETSYCNNKKDLIKADETVCTKIL